MTIVKKAKMNRRTENRSRMDLAVKELKLYYELFEIDYYNKVIILDLVSFYIWRVTMLEILNEFNWNFTWLFT